MIQTFLFVSVLERSLEIAEVLRGGGRRWWRQEAGLHTFWIKYANYNKIFSTGCNTKWAIISGNL